MTAYLLTEAKHAQIVDAMREALYVSCAHDCKEALVMLMAMKYSEPVAFYTPERMDGFIPASVRIKKDASSNAPQLPLYALGDTA